MTPTDLIQFAFDDLEGTIEVFAKDSDVRVYDLQDLPDALPGVEKGADLDLLINGDTCVGVVSTAAPATFYMVNGAWTVPVVLFEVPVPLETVPEDFVITIPMPVNGWEFVEGTMSFVDSGEVLEVTHAESPVEVSSLDRRDAEGTDVVRAATGQAHSAPESAREGVETAAGDADEPAGAGDAARRAKEEREEASDGQPVAEGVEPSSLNDAVILGADDVAMEALLDMPATLMLGKQHGPRDGKNTQDGDWKSTTMPWGAWIAGAPATKNTAAWGFSRHPVGKDKEGDCIVLGSSVGGARKANAMDKMYAIGLDIDSGIPLKRMIQRLEELGIFALVYTSFNHGKSGIELKRDEVLRKLGIKSDPDNAQVREYLKLHDKHRYEEDFIANVAIKQQKHQTPTGVKIVLDTPPLDKFRLIFPLAEPVKLIDLADTQADALSIWEDKITGLAVETLGVHFDTSCTDPSRLFYTARHPKGADHYSAVVRGVPLKFEDVPLYKKAIYTKSRELKLSPWELAGDDMGMGDKPPMALTPAGRSLNDWHTEHKDRFQLADLLEHFCPDRIRNAGGEAQGSVHVECPFEHEHSSEGGTATMAINALDSSSGYWTWFCHHDSCQGRHKLQFLEEALRAEWFPEEVLTDVNMGYVLPPEDSEDEPEEESPEEKDSPTEDAAPKTPLELAAELNKDSTLEEIQKYLKRMHRRGVDMAVRANITAALTKNTNLEKREIKGMWATLDKEQRTKEIDREREEEGGIAAAIVNEWDFDKICTYADRRVKDTNAKRPSIFHYMENLVIIRENSEGHARVKFLDKMGFAHHLNTVARFCRVSGEKGATTGVSCPDDVVNFLYAADYGLYPELRGLVSTPTFTRSGHLLSKEGYDSNSRLFYKPDITLSVPAVNPKPSKTEIEEAKRLLVEEVFADFPLGGMTRPEIVEKVLGGEDVPAVANLFALVLLPFMREMIDGPTPGHLLVKPAPGTGASLLTDAFSTLVTGQVTPALAMPTSKEEMSKTLTSVLSNGQNIVFFDNINHSVDSGELASAMTSPTYQARILGKTQTIEVDVRCAWVFTGNNVELSPELVRRLVMIDLDANVASPETRTGFRHGDIRGWVRENRGRLVWACLTLIQHYIAEGCPIQNDVILASYENWSRVIGGVLKAAGINGFMKNKDALKTKATSDADGDFPLLLKRWWDESKNVGIPILVPGNSVKPTTHILGLLGIEPEINLPLRVNPNNDYRYDATAVGKYIGKMRDRVFQLEDGTEIRLIRAEKRGSHGFEWTLVRAGTNA
jgi:hypothetical protein